MTIARPRYKTVAEYRRRGPVREPYDIVLIVCEGQKTEPLYLRRLRQIHRLSSANIQVTPSPGQDPLSVVRYAEEQLTGGDFDQIYCVFDRDGHHGYDGALRRIAELRKAGKNITAIVSWPCFEVWLLLHFVYTSRPFERVRNTSACERVIRDLKSYIPGYEKGRGALYDDLMPKQADAITHAIRLEKENAGTGTQNPSTKMHALVDYLLKIRAT